MDEITDIVTNGHNIVILGGPGTGKTTLLYKLNKLLIENAKLVQCLAPTGMAARALPNGVTIDSFFSFGDGRYTLEEVVERADKVKIRKTEVFIIDEISMVSSHKLDKVSLASLVRGSEILAITNIERHSRSPHYLTRKLRYGRHLPFCRSWKIWYSSFYFEYRDKLGMVSGVLGHEKTIGNGPRWLGSIFFTKNSTSFYGRNYTLRYLKNR